MAVISQHKVQKYLAIGKKAATTAAQGKSLEDLICYIFGKVPGIAITRRNQKNVFKTEEVDVAIWNDRQTAILFSLPNLILIECKNWSSPVGHMEVAWFDTKLENRGVSLGILIALNGITGNSDNVTASHLTIAASLKDKRQIIVITETELSALRDTNQLLLLIKEKLCDLAVSGRCL
jgi:hypothetical protein